MKTRAPAGARTVTRTFALRAEDVKNREVALAFSSETPVRDFAFEPPVVFLHEEGAASLDAWRDQGSVLLNHDPNRIIGAPLTVKLDERARKGRATIRLDDDPEGETALRKIRGGSLRGVSARFSLEKVQRLDEGEQWMSPEGRRFDGPILVVNRWTLQEVSLTPIPADAAVGVGRNQRTSMDDFGKDDDADTSTVKPERRTARGEALETFQALRKIADKSGLPGDTLDRWLHEGTTLERAREEALDHMQARQGTLGRPGSRVELGADERDRFIEHHALSLRARAGWGRKEDAGKEIEHFSLMELAKRCLKRAGLPASGPGDMIAMRALQHSGSDFPGVVESSIGKSVALAFAEASTTYQTWAKIATSQRLLQPESRIALSAAPGLEEVLELMPITEGSFLSQKEAITTRTYARRFGISRQAIVNDDQGVFSGVPAAFGAAAARKVDELAYGVLTANAALGQDGVALFHATHGNLGTGGALSATTLGELIKLMRLQKSNGAILNVQPRYLVVPAAIEFTARELLASRTKPTGTTPVDNVFLGIVEVVVSAQLDASSATAYYLLAGPSMPVVEVDFLNGQQAPSLVPIDGTSILGREWLAFLDIGVAAVDFRGGAKNAGV